MEKRYQVFVSSTYEDLQEERREVMQALLELDCIPAGMELFPAADEDQWTLIKRVIDDCDYYLVIVAGRYGSTNTDGVSYTEMEYRYAVRTGKPIIAFLHADPGRLEARRSEKEPEAVEKLALFRSLCKKKMCKTWSSAAELGSAVSRSVVKLIKQSPGVGWIRADRIPDAVSSEMLALREQVDALQHELKKLSTEPPPGTANLSQGDDPFEIRYTLEARPRDGYLDEKFTAVKKASWNDIFFTISPMLIDESSEAQIRATLNEQLREWTSAPKGYHRVKSFAINTEDFNTIKVQLRALGLIAQSEKARSVKDTATYWKLTPYGDTVMTQLRAITRDSSDKRDDADEPQQERSKRKSGGGSTPS